MQNIFFMITIIISVQKIRVITKIESIIIDKHIINIVEKNRMIKEKKILWKEILLLLKVNLLLLNKSKDLYKHLFIQYFIQTIISRLKLTNIGIL